MLFCYFDEKNSEKTHSKLLKMFFCFLMFFEIRTTVRVTILFAKAEYKKPIFQGFISRVLLI